MVLIKITNFMPNFKIPISKFPQKQSIQNFHLMKKQFPPLKFTTRERKKTIFITKIGHKTPQKIERAIKNNSI